MSEPAKPHRTELARRIGYAFSLAGTTAAAVIVNVWPSWHAVPYITDAAEPVIQLINISLLLRIAFNVIFLFLESPVLTAGCDLMSAVIGLAALRLMWTTFPFSFPADSGWDATAHLVLAVMTIGTGIALTFLAISFIRNFLRLVSELTDQGEFGELSNH